MPRRIAPRAHREPTPQTQPTLRRQSNIQSQPASVDLSTDYALKLSDTYFQDIIDTLTATLRKTIALRDLYMRLLSFVSLFMFYMVIMGLQFETSEMYELVSSISMAALPPKYDVMFLPWLKTQVLEVWTDPVCGNGRCETPYEYPSFGR
ncbi:hypothetical protein CYMTET_46702 [Cymbomonas tetramitiformis]|uniref:Uncharacterized protein n=1 Tax=Cymbomonas tetramitiformis TaxID=36881 RepID=A0AAE0EYF3_9CHLO|nr:hypothetical protein CYMTET_46702 [Cymbomonas tetramitiformis]